MIPDAARREWAWLVSLAHRKGKEQRYPTAVISNDTLLAVDAYLRALGHPIEVTEKVT